MTPETILNDRDIVIYALYSLGGYQNRVHTEDIALKCYEIAPSRFSWVKYPRYPDIQPVRFALEKCKSLIVGSSERKQSSTIPGWRLTEKGIQWIEVNIGRVERQLEVKQSPKERLVGSRRLKSLMKSPAFSKFTTRGEKTEIPYVEFAESLICTVNTKPEILLERLEQLYSTADILKQNEVKEYLNYCRKRFSKQVRGVEYG